MHSKRPWRDVLRGQAFLLVAAAVATVFLVSGAVPLRDVPHVEDGRLLATLASLVLAVEALRVSGALDGLVRRTVARFSRARSFTAALVFASGVLAAVVTNDVALFVVVPFTLAAARHSDFRARNAVVLEVTAANVLGCVSPIGNPQNLFLLHRSGLTIGEFVGAMVPFGAVAAALLALAVRLLEPSRPIVRIAADIPPLHRALAAWGIAGIALVLVSIAGWAPVWLPLAATTPAIVPLARRGAKLDALAIVPLFFFVFIAMAGASALDFGRVFASIPLPPGPRLFAAGTSFSQAISNVPAAVLLAPAAAGQWKTLLWAVNAGGCGTLVASLANLIGWQIYVRERGTDPVYLKRFHVVSFAFLGALGVAAFLLV